MKEKNREIGQAVKALIADSGFTQTEIAERLSINKSSLSQMLSGVAPLPYERFIRIAEMLQAADAEIEKIRILYIKKAALKLVDDPERLPKIIAAASQELARRNTEKDENVRFVDNVFPPDKVFPVICEAAAAEVNTLAFPIAEYASEHSAERQYFPDGQEGDFVIQVTGRSMMPWYPPGTLLLVRANQRIRHGERVIAIMDDGEVIFKVYAQKDNKFALMSLDDHGADYFYPPRSPSEIRGLYRVISSLRNEANLDEAMREAGIPHRWEEKFKSM